MVVKDRLTDFKREQEEEDDFPLEQMSPSMQGFFAEVEEIRENIDKIHSNVEEVKKKHSDILSCPQTDDKVKQELEDFMADIKKISNRVRTKLKAMEQNIEKKKDMNCNTELRMCETQHTMLSQKFVEVMLDYNKTQMDYRDRCKARIQRQLEITGKSTTEEEVEEMLATGTSAVLTQDIVMNDQQANQSFADIEARHADIVKLETSIKELHDMFLDMAMLVESQGEMIDRIEFHVTKAQSDVEAACRDTKQAMEYQRKARKKKLMMMLCGAITMIILLFAAASYLGLLG